MAVLSEAQERGSPLMARTVEVHEPAACCWRVRLLLVMAALVWMNSARAATPREYQIKAAFLYNFAQFTEWPAEAWENAQSPLVIGVLGANPFGDFVEQTVRNEFVHGRRIAVEYYAQVTDIKTCHILYVGQSEVDRIQVIRDALKGKPVLTVSDIEKALDRGMMIEFVTSQNRIRFRIDAEAAKAAGLVLSAKLLRVATPSPR